MAYIFSLAPGYAAVLVDNGALPVTIWIENPAGLWMLNVVSQGITVQTKANFQLTNTLRDFLYIYVFGELPGDMTLHGYCMPGDCQPF